MADVPTQSFGVRAAILRITWKPAYFIELTTETSTAYEELQSFLTLSNTIFQVLSVETTYTDLKGTNAPTPNPRLWADGCVWDSNL